jgi:cytosine/uracil/thiamine/allantoin permease
MADDRRSRTPWITWMFVASAALLVLRFALHAVAHLLDLASTVIVVGVIGLVAWRVAAGGRRGRSRE